MAMFHVEHKVAAPGKGIFLVSSAVREKCAAPEAFVRHAIAGHGGRRGVLVERRCNPKGVG